MLLHFPTFNYLKHKFYYNFEIIEDIQFRCLDGHKLCHMAQYKSITWHIHLNFYKNKLKLTFR